MKLTNEVLKERQALKKSIKEAEARLAEIDECIKLKGSFYTREYVVTVTTQQRTNVAGLPRFLEAGITKDWLEQRSLLNHTEFKIVNISEQSKKEDVA